MKASPIRLGDDKAVERVAMKCGKRRKGEDVFERHRLQHQSILLLLVTVPPNEHVRIEEEPSRLATEPELVRQRRIEILRRFPCSRVQPRTPCGA
jgi:hypothetical protein